MLAQFRDTIDAKTAGVFSGSGLYFATINIDLALSRAIGVVTLILAILKLAEFCWKLWRKYKKRDEND